MPTEKSLKILLWLVAIGFFMRTLDCTIVNTALPAMAASLGESPLRMQSVVIAYSLTEIMPVSVRTAGFSLAYSLATAIFGGFTPAVSTWLIE